MQTIEYPIDYEDAIATLVRELPVERAAQLYDFARFLLEDTRSMSQSAAIEQMAAEEQISDEELATEDALWESSMIRHADRFATLKTQAKADVKAGRTAPMFNGRGEFSVE
jgi:uncharacterized protein YfeS